MTLREDPERERIRDTRKSGEDPPSDLKRSLTIVSGDRCGGRRPRSPSPPSSSSPTNMGDQAAPSNDSAVRGVDTNVHGGMSVEECTKGIKKSFKLPMVRFLREELEKAGCPVKENFFKAIVCDRQVGGSYLRGQGIFVCGNHLHFQDEIDQTIIHELIHAYDDCRAANMNWSNCAHHACSEIRAGHLSGDCHFKRELLRGHLKLRGHEQDCVRRRVMMSLAANPYCSQAAAKDAMEAVWDICYNDTKPFDRAP